MLSKSGALIAPISLAAPPPVILPVLIQQKTATTSNGAGGITATFDVPVTVGNSVIVEISFASGFVTTVSIQNPSPEILVAGITKNGTLIRTAIWYIHNITSAHTQIVVTGSAANRLSFNASEWSGLTNAAPEATNSAATAANANPATGSVSPASANNLVIASGAWTLDDYSTGPTNGFTRLDQTGGSVAWLESAYLIQSSATAAGTDWTLTAGINWAAAIAVFGAP